MNQFKEYLQLTKNGLKNIDKVLEGVKNDVANQFKLLSEDKQRVISERMDICNNCPYNSRNAQVSDEYRSLNGNNYETSRSEFHCSLCGCVIQYKVSSLDSNCGIEYWNKKNPDKQQDLKWTKYEK